MSELGFVAIAALAAVAWQALAMVRRARRGEKTSFRALRRRLVRPRTRRSSEVSIVARGAWMHSIAATYAQAPSRVVIRVQELIVLAAAILAVAGAEAALAFGPVLLGEILAAALIPVLLMGVPERAGSDQLRGVRRLNLALRGLALVPLIRVMAVALDHPDVRPAVSILVIGVLGCWLALRVAPTLQIPRVSLFAYPLQPSAILVGFLLSLVAYLAGAPVLAASGSSGDEVAIALAALTVAAAAEELLFRGVLQGALQRVAGRPGVLLGACLFACTYLGFRSLPLALTMLLAGLLFADVVLRTGATGAVILAHAIAVCCASVVWPYLLGRERPDWIDESVLAGVLTLAVAVALWRLLRGRGASLTIRRGTATRTAAQSRSDDWVADG